MFFSVWKPRTWSYNHCNSDPPYQELVLSRPLSRVWIGATYQDPFQDPFQGLLIVASYQEAYQDTPFQDLIGATYQDPFQDPFPELWSSYQESRAYVYEDLTSAGRTRVCVNRSGAHMHASARVRTRTYERLSLHQVDSNSAAGRAG